VDGKHHLKHLLVMRVALGQQLALLEFAREVRPARGKLLSDSLGCCMPVISPSVWSSTTPAWRSFFWKNFWPTSIRASMAIFTDSVDSWFLEKRKTNGRNWWAYVL